MIDAEFMHRDAIIMERHGEFLRPVSNEAAAAINKLEDGQQVAIKILRRRSVAQNAKYWSVLDHLVEATGRWRSAEELHLALKCATGRVDLVRLIDGRLIKVPGSISFDAMSADEASEYYTAAYRVIENDLGVPIEEVA